MLSKIISTPNKLSFKQPHNINTFSCKLLELCCIHFSSLFLDTSNIVGQQPTGNQMNEPFDEILDRVSNVLLKLSASMHSTSKEEEQLANNEEAEVIITKTTALTLELIASATEQQTTAGQTGSASVSPLEVITDTVIPLYLETSMQLPAAERGVVWYL